jgi:alpha-D-ribose 1-methylphosphonate 5-triphosphate diphosphatase
MIETILTNARLVLREEVRDGTVVVDNAGIVEVQPGRSFALSAVDIEGDYLIPGVVDVHTDNLERQVQPRSSARWPSRSAMLAHDAQCAVAGVTTVLDALCIGDLGFDLERLQTFRDAVVDLDALAHTGLFKSDHFLHLRCEMPAPDVIELFDPVAEHPLVRMVSLMDHSPGVGQYADLERYRALRRKGGMAEAQIEQRIAELTDQRARHRTPNRKTLLARVAALGLPIASHDDRTIEEIEENAADGIDISEFPVTMEAAQAARTHGMEVIAGAPNIVRGGSHSGNVKVADLVEAGAIDAFASDYVPPSLIEAAFQCARQSAIVLPEAIALITDHPARMTRLADRGRIEAGLRADLVRVRLHGGLPVVRQVWRAGERVA